MANYLILNQNQIWNGLGTLTYTVTAAGQYNVQCQSTFPAGPAQNAVLDASKAGISGNTLGFVNAGSVGSGAGLGAGTGGGGSGFVDGDAGAGYGGVGQGFGTGNNYQQPPSAGSNVVANTPTTSELSILVKKNGSTIYTATTPAVIQSALQFRTSFSANLGDSITVVLSSSASSDNQLSGITSNISIGEGL